MSCRVDTMPGIAFHEPSICEVTDHHDECMLVIMVGDDYVYHVDRADIKLLHDDEYCGGCGQIGCTANG